MYFQVFHVCHHDGTQDSYLCPNGTLFNQKYFVCDWWYNFNCEDAPFFYPVNAALSYTGIPFHDPKQIQLALQRPSRRAVEQDTQEKRIRRRRPSKRGPPQQRIRRQKNSARGSSKLPASLNQRQPNLPSSPSHGSLNLPVHRRQVPSSLLQTYSQLPTARSPYQASPSAVLQTIHNATSPAKLPPIAGAIHESQLSSPDDESEQKQDSGAVS